MNLKFGFPQNEKTVLHFRYTVFPFLMYQPDALIGNVVGHSDFETCLPVRVFSKRKDSTAFFSLYCLSFFDVPTRFLNRQRGRAL